MRSARRRRSPVTIVAALAVALAIGAWLGAGVGVGANRHSARSILVGALFQLRGARGCLSERPRDGCGRARALAGAGGVAIAGRYVYVASAGSNAVAIFRRNPVTGALQQLSGRAGCVSETGKDGCAHGRGLSLAFSVAISPNGRNLYVAGLNDVAAFARNPRSGQLKQLPGAEACIGENGDGCAPGRALRDVASVAVSPDGANVYAVSSSDPTAGYRKSGVVALARNASTGALTELPGVSGCTNGDGSEGCQRGKALQLAYSVVVAPDGRYVYVGSEVSSAVVSFARGSNGALRQIPSAGGCTSEGGREGCATGRGLNEVAGLAISRDGQYLYAGASRSSAVAALFLTPSTGGIDQLKGPNACTAEHGFEGCATGLGLTGAGPLALSPAGLSLYAGGLNSLSVFGREPSNGTIAELPRPYACFTEGRPADGCLAGRGLAGVSSVAVSPDGRSVYVVSLPSIRNGTVAVFARVPGPISLRVSLAGVPRRCVRAPFTVSVLAHGTMPVRSLRLTLDRRVLAHSSRSLLKRRIDDRRLSRGSHTLRGSVTDLAGDKRSVSVRFKRC